MIIENKLQRKAYQICLDGWTDLQLVTFLLHFMDEVNEHVCLGQVLYGQHTTIRSRFTNSV